MYGVLYSRQEFESRWMSVELICRGGSRINFRVLQNFTKKIENRNDVTMQKNYRFSKKQDGMVLITVGVQI